MPTSSELRDRRGGGKCNGFRPCLSVGRWTRRSLACSFLGGFPHRCLCALVWMEEHVATWQEIKPSLKSEGIGLGSLTPRCQGATFFFFFNIYKLKYSRQKKNNGSDECLARSLGSPVRDVQRPSKWDCSYCHFCSCK